MPRTRRKQQNQEEGRHLVEDEDEQSAHAQGDQPEETRANTRTNVGPAGYQIRGVLMDASWAYDLLCCLT